MRHLSLYLLLILRGRLPHSSLDFRECIPNTIYNVNPSWCPVRPVGSSTATHALFAASITSAPAQQNRQAGKIRGIIRGRIRGPRSSHLFLYWGFITYCRVVEIVGFRPLINRFWRRAERPRCQLQGVTSFCVVVIGSSCADLPAQRV